jgi:enhancer of mRNA-decapping protein 3
MATALIGISVSVTLQNPPNTVVEGHVADVNPQTSTLTLQNGTILLELDGLEANSF